MLFDDDKGKELNDLIISYIEKQKDLKKYSSLSLVAVMLSIAARLHVLTTGGDFESFNKAVESTYKSSIKEVSLSDDLN